MKRFIVRTLLVVSLPVLLVGAAPAAQKGQAADQKTDATRTCAGMMQGAGVTEEGRQAMREFMHSDKAPQAMANMMEMARKMGNGDMMLGMTKMMEMMGSMGGGMMGSHGGTTAPGPGQPGK